MAKELCIRDARHWACFSLAPLDDVGEKIDVILLARS
jgi:hypothetical protein